MKKTAVVLLMFCVLMSAVSCTKENPTTSDSTAVVESSVASQEESAAESLPEEISTESVAVEPSSSDDELPLYPIFSSGLTLDTGNGYAEEGEGDGKVYVLDEAESEKLKQIINEDEWEIQHDVPSMGGFSVLFMLTDSQNTWFFTNWNDTQIMILPSSPNLENSEKTIYLAPLSVSDEVLAYANTLTPAFN